MPSITSDPKGKNRTAALVAFMSLAFLVRAIAAEFPLSFRTIDLEDALYAPGSGPVGGLYLKWPMPLVGEPEAKSSRPLYGIGGLNDRARQVYRIDESQGTGKGYDRFILDLNGNRDLRDDPVAEGRPQKRSGIPLDYVVFGPIEAPASVQVGPWRPIYHAVMEYRQADLALFLRRNVSPGNVRVKSGWYLEASVDLDGAKEKIGLLDGDRDLRLGVESAANAGGGFLPLYRSDSVLRDRNASGRFDFDLCESECDSAANRIGIGRNVYTVTVAKDLRSVRLERYTGPQGKLAVAAHADKLRAVRLTSGDDNFVPVLIDGESVVPAGVYTIESCTVASASGETEPAMTRGWFGEPDKIRIRPDRATTVRCGPPLELRLEAKRVGSRTPKGVSIQKIEIDARVIGAGGERYVRHAKGGNLTAQADPPRFRIFDAQGKEIASGRFEYG